MSKAPDAAYVHWHFVDTDRRYRRRMLTLVFGWHYHTVWIVLPCCSFVVADIVGVLADPPEGVQLDSGFNFLMAEVRVSRAMI